MKVLVAFGTRPEAIKMAPVIKSLKSRAEFEVVVVVSGQHREMLYQVLNVFDIRPDFDLQVMQSGQDLFDTTTLILKGMRTILQKVNPDLILVHGDTTTSMASALASYYVRIPIGHVEAGLRTYDLHAPFPEEANRQITARLAAWHFAPTGNNASNLIKEGIDSSRIFVTGNTVIDALLWMRDEITASPQRRKRINAELAEAGLPLTALDQPQILITGHRRENFGRGFEDICRAILKLSQSFTNVSFIYPVHLNPNVLNPVNSTLGDRPNVHLISPLSYEPFVWLMDRCSLILTDSGGIQEEGPSFGKPVLVMRNSTERPEGVAAGTVRLVGTDPTKIFDEVGDFLSRASVADLYEVTNNPYGDGRAADRITDYLLGL